MPYLGQYFISVLSFSIFFLPGNHWECLCISVKHFLAMSTFFFYSNFCGVWTSYSKCSCLWWWRSGSIFPFSILSMFWERCCKCFGIWLFCYCLFCVCPLVLLKVQRRCWNFFLWQHRQVALIPNILIAHFSVCRRLVSLRVFKEYLQSPPFTQKDDVSCFL